MRADSVHLLNAVIASAFLENRTGGFELRQGPYVVRLATETADLIAALRLRFEVFNLEVGEGLESAYLTGHDTDEFDPVCSHLVVEHAPSRRVVGTYRLQTGSSAKANLGYYSEREFDFSPYEPFRCETIELGRACVHADHRNFNLLQLLWRGIACYAVERNARFLIGCSSISSQDTVEGAETYEELKHYLVEPHLRTQPRPDFRVVAERDHLSWCGRCTMTQSVASTITAGASSRLLRAYLAIGAKICGPPGIDRDFGTIDFLTLLDLHLLPAIVRAHFPR